MTSVRRILPCFIDGCNKKEKVVNIFLKGRNHLTMINLIILIIYF
jgi:hypothetical protein